MTDPANDNEPMSTFLLVLKGQIAALSGQSLASNPYRLDTPEGLYWTSGWQNTRVELDQNEPSTAIVPALHDDRPPPRLRVVLTGS